MLFQVFKLFINVTTQISQIATQVSCLNYDSHDCPQSAILCVHAR